MKTILLPILFLALFSCNSLKNTSEVNDKYKPLKKFKPLKDAEIGSDTADYLTYNFITHKEQYIGKPFYALVKDLKITISKILITPIYFDRAYCNNITILFYSPTIDKKGVEYYLDITFNEKFNYAELNNIQNIIPNSWSKLHFNFLKDRTIQNIIVGDSRNWKKKL